MLDIKQFSAGEFPLAVQMMVTLTGSGIVVQLLGGNRPHIGATVITHPRPSLANDRTLSCNSIIIPEMGHKEDELAKPLAEKISKAMNCTVVLVAGIHIDNASLEDIQYVKNICWKLVDEFLSHSCKG